MSIQSTVQDILQYKQIQGALVIDPDASVYEALEAMAKYNVGALLVVEGEELLGIVTERDYSRKVVLRNQSSRETRVSQIMQANTCNVTPYDTAQYCLSVMVNEKVRHLPVFDMGELIGIVSMGDIVHAVISDNEFMIDQLTRYVTGSVYAPQSPEW